MGRAHFPIKQGVRSNQKKFQLSTLWDMLRTGYPHFLMGRIMGKPYNLIMWPYLSTQAKNQKSEGTLLPATFKVEEGQVPLLFSFVAQGLRYSHVIISMMTPFSLQLHDHQHIIKCPYLSSQATNQKIKYTQISPTFKVPESKVSLLF